MPILAFRAALLAARRGSPRSARRWPLTQRSTATAKRAAASRAAARGRSGRCERASATAPTSLREGRRQAQLIGPRRCRGRPTSASWSHDGPLHLRRQLGRKGTHLFPLLLLFVIVIIIIVVVVRMPAALAARLLALA